jgi:hypothetical protein
VAEQEVLTYLNAVNKVGNQQRFLKVPYGYRIFVSATLQAVSADLSHSTMIGPTTGGNARSAQFH